MRGEVEMIREEFLAKIEEACRDLEVIYAKVDAVEVMKTIVLYN
jgi:hypothetical protein